MDMKEENNVEEGLHMDPSSSHQEAQATQREETAVEKEVEGLQQPELAEGSRSNEARTTQMSVQSILVSSNYPEVGERPEGTASGFEARGSQRSQRSTLSMPETLGRNAVRLSNATNRSTKSNRSGSHQSGSRSWQTDQSSPDSFLQDEYSRLFTAAQVQATWMQRKRAASDADLSQLEQRPTRQFAKQIVESRCFTYTLTFLILVHVVLMGLEVDAYAALGNDSVPEWFDIANLILVCIFVGELFMKLMALGFMDFWCGKDWAWNAFDFLVIAFSVTDVVLALTKRASVSTAQVRVFRLLRIFRYFRSIRVVRLFRYISALQVLTLSILGTMSSLAWTLALLVLVIYSFSVVLTEMVVQYCWQPEGEEAVKLCKEETENGLRTFFSNVPGSMMSLFMAISQGLNWEDLIRPLWNVSVVAYYLVIVYVIITIFAILNVVTGVFCNTAIESAGADKDIRTLKQIQAKSQQVELLKSVFHEIDFEQVNEISFQDVKRCLANGDLASFVESMGISTDDVWTLFMLLDADQTGLLDLDEFVNGCMQLHGPAQSLQVAKMSYENKLTRAAIKNVFKELAEVKGRLVRLNRNLDEARWQNYETQNESHVQVEL